MPNRGHLHAVDNTDRTTEIAEMLVERDGNYGHSLGPAHECERPPYAILDKINAKRNATGSQEHGGGDAERLKMTIQWSARNRQ